MKVYIAGPYTGYTGGSLEESCRILSRIALQFMTEGHIVYSPISHSHTIAVMNPESEIQRNWEFWKQQDYPFIEWCDVLVVVTMDGWQTSEGVQAEIAYADALEKMILYVSPDRKGK